MLAALLLVVLFIALSCSGSGGDDTAKQKGAGNNTPIPSPSASAGSGVLTPETPEPSFAESKPAAGGPVGPAATNVPAGPVSVAPGLPVQPPVGQAAVPPGGLPAAANGPCTDAEMAIAPVPARTAAKRGQPIDLRLIIKNISTRPCARDVGADMQEIYIKQGALKIWSSDVCGLAKGSKVEQFLPNGVREYLVTWNGRDSTRCAGGMAAGNFPAPGQYEVLGRLGVEVSNPVTIVLS